MNNIGVIQLIDTLDAGGAEVLAVNIANSLSKKNVNSYLCATRKEGALINNLKSKSNYFFLNRKKTIDFKRMLVFKKYLKNNNITIIHAHATSYFFATCIKIIYPKIKIVWHNHFGNNINLNGYKLHLLKFCSLFFSLTIHVNEDLKKWSNTNLFCSKNYYLENFPFFNNSKKITQLKGVQGKRIVHVASFRPEKNHETLIKAFSDFLKDNNSDWTLHLIGSINDSNYSKRIVKLAKSLSNNIFIYDSCLDIENILNQSDIGVLSSKFEGLPIALLEYGLSKLPVIVTNVGQCNKVIVHNKSGYIVAKNNYSEFSEKLKLLANSKEDRRIFGQNNFKIIKEFYSEENFLINIIKIYKSLV